MKWAWGWVVSVVMIYILGYYHQFYSSLSELINGIDIWTFLLVLALGILPASMGFISALLINKFLSKWLNIDDWKVLIIALFFSVIFCIPIMHKIHLILTET